jgi:hypothetical protein
MIQRRAFFFYKISFWRSKVLSKGFIDKLLEIHACGSFALTEKEAFLQSLQPSLHETFAFPPVGGRTFFPCALGGLLRRRLAHPKFSANNGAERGAE